MGIPQIDGNPRMRYCTDSAIEKKDGHYQRYVFRGRESGLDNPNKLLLAVLAIVIVAAFLAVTTPGSGTIESAAQGVDAIINEYIDMKDKSTPVSEWEKGSMPYLYQTDDAWASKKYGDGHIEDYGCGPTCMSMVYVYLTGSKKYAPDKMARFSERNGFIDQGVTSWLLMSEGVHKLGLKSEEVGADPALVKSHLHDGNPVICIVGPGDFTTDGHFIVLCGVNDDGSIEIRDPNSAERSHKSWDIDDIIDQSRNIWCISA